MVQFYRPPSPWKRPKVRPRTVAQLIHSSDLDEPSKNEALSNFPTPNESDILTAIFEIPHARNPNFIGEVFRGAHIRIFDDGARYDDWKTLPSVASRWLSSHHSDGPQYHVDGPLVHTLLFGKVGKWTWVQLERHSIADLVNLIPHGIDLIRYLKSHKNQGPYGTSDHAEHNNPLDITPTWPYVPIDRSSPFFKMSRNPRPDAKDHPFR